MEWIGFENQECLHKIVGCVKIKIKKGKGELWL